MVSLKGKNKGFTIVELLIVIVVIGILATLVLITFNGIQQKGRDSKRKTDLGSIQQALDTYYTNNNTYPTLAHLQTASWVQQNLKGLDAAAFSDPKSSNGVSGGIAVKGTVDGYHYVATAGDNTTFASPTTCDDTSGASNPCANFELSTGLEADSNNIFSKVSNN